MTLNTDDLRAILREQALATPVNPARHAEIDKRVRRMRRRRAAIPAVTGAAGVVAIVLAGTLVGGSGQDGSRGQGPTTGTRPERTAEPRPVRVTPADLPEAEPAEKLWPGAVHSLPAKLPDGRELTPVGFVDARRMLVTTEASFERVGSVWEYDLTSGRAREIVQVPIPPKLKAADDRGLSISLPNDFTIGAGRVSWWLGYQDGQKWFAEIWSAPAGGGPARRVTTIKPSRDRGNVYALLAVAGDKVVWSGSGGEVFEAPLAGGTARRIGPAGSQLVAWPWIGSPAAPDQPLPASERNRLEPRNAGALTLDGELRNVLTGERRTEAAVTGRWTCGLAWCLGTTKDAEGGAIRRRGETRARSIPGSGTGHMKFEVQVAALDRFVLRYAPGRVAELYDLKTGRLGRLGRLAAGADPGTGLAGFDIGQTFYRELFGERYVVVDLTAIR